MVAHFTGKPIKTIGFDCDDTLWHNENIFQGTHEKFSALIHPYVSENVDVIEQRLHATEIKNLKLFGYGVKGFTLSMIETAVEMTQAQIGAAEIGHILDFGKDMLRQPVNVFPGVRETLESLAQDYRLVALTKGDLFDQEGKVARSGLGDLFDHVEVMSEKDAANYAAIFERQEIDIESFLMVGNSLKSDILPILELGGRAVYIPYRLTWAHERVDLPEGLPHGAWKLDSMTAVPGILSQFRD